MGEQSGLGPRRQVSFARTGRGRGPYPVLPGNAGSVLLALIVTIVILAAMTAAILPTLFTAEMGQVSASGALRAYYLAEAGGRYTLPRFHAIPVGTHTFKFSGGDTFFEIEKISETRFVSTGVLGEGSTLEARVAITYHLESLFEYALFGGDGITTGNGVVIDSYSSSGNPTEGENGDVGTNAGNLDGIGGGTVVYGVRDVSVGKDLTPVPLPAGAPSWTDKTSELNMVSNNQTVNLGAGQYYTAAINLTNGSTVTISGDVVLYVAGATGAFPTSTLDITAGASLTIYAGGDLDLSNNTLVNHDQIPAHFIIYGLAGCQDIQWGSACGAIYAPMADILLINGAVVYGALIGETITVKNTIDIHYDEDLGDIAPDSVHVEQYFTGE